MSIKCTGYTFSFFEQIVGQFLNSNIGIYFNLKNLFILQTYYFNQVLLQIFSGKRPFYKLGKYAQYKNVPIDKAQISVHLFFPVIKL